MTPSTLTAPEVSTQEIPVHEIPALQIDVEEIEIENVPSDGGVGGSGGSPPEPDDDRHRDPGHDPEPLGAPPLSVYRAVTFWAMLWIAMLFAALTVLVKVRWVDSDDWMSVPLPRVLYLNTAILLFSSLTMRRARALFLSDEVRRGTSWLFVTLLLGFAFIVGQLVAWRELVSEGLYLASNPGSFFIYLISGTHGLHVLGGITALGFVAFFARRWTNPAKRCIAIDAVATYWHFMDGLWLYLLALLFITIQR